MGEGEETKDAEPRDPRASRIARLFPPSRHLRISEALLGAWLEARFLQWTRVCAGGRGAAEQDTESGVVGWTGDPGPSLRAGPRTGARIRVSAMGSPPRFLWEP